MDITYLKNNFGSLVKYYNQRKGQRDKLLDEKEAKKNDLEKINRDIDKLLKV